MSVGIGKITPPPSQQDIEAGRTDGSLNLAQLAFEQLANPIQVLIGGFGIGKSYELMRKISASQIHNSGSRAMVIAPTYKHTRIDYEAMLGVLRRTELAHKITLAPVAKRSSQEMVVGLVNGSQTQFYSASGGSSLLGPTVAAVGYDELEWMDAPRVALDAGATRLREQSRPGECTVHPDSRYQYITSTAQTLTGELADFIARARAGLAAVAAARAQRKRPPIPEVGVVVAPSTVAIGHGLTIDMIRLWKSQIERATFLRAVMALLTPPPEVVFGDYVSDREYPHGHVIDWKWRADCVTYLLVDWGINNPHILVCQYAHDTNALVVVEEWGPERSSVAQTILEMVRIGNEHGLCERDGGRPIVRYPDGSVRRQPRERFNALLQVIGDPTTNPGQSLLNPSEDHVLALEGQAALSQIGWRYQYPAHPRQRSNRLQMLLLRALLRPPSGPPRILFNRPLLARHDEETRLKRTRRGIWHSLSAGLKFKRDKLGNMVEELPARSLYKHSFDALAYGAVMIFSEFNRLLDLETGLLSGAGAWGDR